MNVFFRRIMTAAICGAAGLGVQAAGPETTAPSVRVEKVTELSQTEPKTYVGTVAASPDQNLQRPERDVGNSAPQLLDRLHDPRIIRRSLHRYSDHHHCKNHRSDNTLSESHGSSSFEL